MNRALALVGIALCGACSSDSGGGAAPAASGGSALPSNGGGPAAGQGGTTAVDPSIPPLTIVSISPEDGASGVALDASIEIRFSAPLDPLMTNLSNIVVEGPNGPLLGMMTVEGDRVTLEASPAMPLLTSFRISLSAGLRGRDGGVLAEPVDAQFLTRDGVFREPLQINAGGAVSLALRGNDDGDLIAAWTDLQVTSSVEGMVFDNALGTWSAAQSLESDAALAFTQPVAAVAPNGDSIVAWRGGGWTRYTGSWGTATVGAGIALPSVALGASAALAVANADGNASYQLLPNGASEWSAPQTLLMAGRVDAIDVIDGEFIAVGSRQDGTLVASQLSTPEDPWTEFVSLAELAELEGLRLTTHADTAAVAWVDLIEVPATETQELSFVTRPGARVFAEGAWSPSLAVPDGADLPWISVTTGARALAVWTLLDAVNVSSYSAAAGWTAPLELAEQSQLAPSAAIDSSGNFMALWPESEQIAVQRQAAGGQWQALAPLDSQVTVALWSHVDRMGRVSLVWQNGSGIWWTRFE